MAQGYFPGYAMQQYDEDSDHSVNGWIKKEPEDEDEIDEEYMKNRQDSDPGDHYEDLMSLSKEELVARILQQEEDIRYLQDIRNGLEKSVQELQGIVKDLSSITSSFKDHQASLSQDNNVPPVSSTRTENSSRTNETSPRATPSSSANVSITSPKPVPASRNNTRLTETSSQSYSSIVPAKERPPTASHSSTVTIVKQTNVVIKTEIPSPPPEPEIIDNPLQMSQMANFQRKRKFDSPPTFQTQQQVQNVQSRQQQQQQQQQQQRMKQKPMPIPQQVHQRPRMSPVRQQGVRGAQQVQGQMNPQTVQNVRMPGPRFAQNQRMQTRGRGIQDMQGQMQRMPRGAAASSVLGRPRLNTVKMSPAVPTASTTTSSSPVTNVLAEIGAKLPKSLSLSLVQPGGGQPIPKTADSGSRSMTIKPADAGDRPPTSNASTFPSNVAKSSGKVVTSNAITSSTSSASEQGKIIQFGDEDDDENDYDEIAVLEPDKKTSGFDDETDKDSHCSLTKKSRTSDGSKDPYSNWNAQNNPMDQNNAGGNMYHNNDEYLLDEPLDDTDLEESDPPAVYLGEDVTLSKEVLQNIIKEAMNHEQLIKNLMSVLFPDLSQLASESNVDANKSYTILPTSKVNAIIELCRKRFPFKNKTDIFGVINSKFQEAKNVGRNNRTRMQYTKQY